MTEIHFDLENASRGIFVNPVPSLSSRAPVILVQRREFLVGEWDSDCAGFIHPENQQVLAKDAEDAVRSIFQEETFASNQLRIFTCPEELASRFEWD